MTVLAIVMIPMRRTTPWKAAATASTRVALAMPQAEVQPDHGLVAKLQTTFRWPGYKPPLLPASTFRLLELSRKQETTFRDLLNILQSDPFIAGQVLRVARSPAYTRGEPVRSLEQALSRLGITALTQIFLQIAVTSRLFRSPGYSAPMEALREHSVMVAHAARLLCRHTRVSDELAFVCGLLHDVGSAMCLVLLGDMPAEQQPSFTLSIEKSIEKMRQEAATIVCEVWDLPLDMRTAIIHHHEPFSNGVANHLGCVVLLADYLAFETGFVGLNEDFCGVELAQTTLGISEVAMKLVGAELRMLAGNVS